MQRPNFIFVLADDLGYAELGCTGAREAVSPALDRVAGDGLLFTQASTPAPASPPSS